jgi:hypothetical protein
MMQLPAMAVAKIAVPSLAYHGSSVRSMLDRRLSVADVALEGVKVRPCNGGLLRLPLR